MPWYRPLLYLWASPATLLGLAPAPLALFGWVSLRCVDGVLEIHGGPVTWYLRHGMPWIGSAMAMTLGHVVWGCDETCLRLSRRHERVHVRQFERWGPIFLPLYLTLSAVQFLRGLDPYRDNPFEVEAYRDCDS